MSDNMTVKDCGKAYDPRNISLLVGWADDIKAVALLLEEERDLLKEKLSVARNALIETRLLLNIATGIIKDDPKAEKEPEKEPEFKQGTLVEVRADDKEKWLPALFKRILEGTAWKYVVEDTDKECGFECEYRQCRLYQPDKPTKQEAER